MVSLLAEHGRIGEPIVGVSFDGTGYGCDETIWGGEILGARNSTATVSTRVGHLLPVPLPGGDAAVRNPWRMALSQLWMADIDWTPDLAPVAAATSRRTAPHPFATGDPAPGCVPCSSMGRLFDAVASLLGVRHRIDYEGQAAIELEALAESADSDPERPAPSLPLAVRPDGVIDPRPDGADDGRRPCTPGTPPAVLAAAFHRAVALAVAEVVDQGRRAGPVGGPHRRGVPECPAAACLSVTLQWRKVLRC